MKMVLTVIDRLYSLCHMINAHMDNKNIPGSNDETQRQLYKRKSVIIILIFPKYSDSQCNALR